MNTLRILSLAGRASRIKQMLGLLIVLLLWPVVASATCPVGQTCILPSLTSGTMTVTDNGSPLAEWTASGFGQIPFGGNPAGFTDAGESGLVEVGLGFPRPYGTYALIETGDFGGVLSMDLTIEGIPWYHPQGGTASAFLTAESLDPRILSAGTYEVFFVFNSFFTGSPDPNLSQCGPCTSWTWGGAGYGLITVADLPGQPDMFYVTGGTFTFQEVRAPEPSTVSLLLIAFAGLAVLARRRHRVLGPLPRLLPT